MIEQKVYVLIDNSYGSDDYWKSGDEIIFMSLDYDKVKAELDKFREEAENWDPANHCGIEIEIDKLTDTCVSYFCDRCPYEYVLLEYPLDTDIRTYNYKHCNDK